VTAAIVVATANAMNLLDGQDGLAGGVSAIAAASIAGVTAAAGGVVVVALGLALAGGLGGFLVWNRPPAKVFLGNGGAYAVGAALASLAAGATELDGMRGAAAAGLCLAIPAVELVLTVARRLGSGTRLAQGDRLHSYDLVTSRVGVGRSTLVFCCLGAVAGGLGIAAALTPLWASVLIAAATLVLLGAGAVLLQRGETPRLRQAR
jgi:UDP-GlcNAc:undecaprenyl-phosphate GlcNAc-1-phosphate transferase